MLRMITRHGQIAPESEFVGNHLYPAGEEPLSDLGREQAALLGERLKEQGFKGKILSSPYMRTLETANIIAEITGLSVIPFAPIREIFKTEEQVAKYKGLTIEQMRKKYNRIDKGATLEYPWWTPVVESWDEITERIKKGIAVAEELYSDEEILFVGHGASSSALIAEYGIPKGLYPFLFNCALSYVDPKNPEIRPVHCDVSHMPYEKTYSNYLSREAFDEEYFNTPYEGEIELPEGIDSIKGTKILHIGDTYSKHYPYFKKLISLVKPDIIIHTGDTSDEVKVGRIPGTRYEYRSKIKFILKCLDESGARVIFVPGNNDVVEDVKEFIPRAEVYPENSIITLDGEECRIGHMVMHMTFDKRWSFYGHGFTGETWEYTDNFKGDERRFNVSYGSFVCSISEDKFFLIKNPKIKR